MHMQSSCQLSLSVPRQNQGNYPRASAKPVSLYTHVLTNSFHSFSLSLPVRVYMCQRLGKLDSGNIIIESTA